MFVYLFKFIGKKNKYGIYSTLPHVNKHASNTYVWILPETTII